MDFETVVMMEKEPEIIAVCVSEMRLYGCPSCGYRSGYTPVSGGGTAIWRCGDCGKTCAVLADGLEVSTVGFGGGSAEESFYPRLQRHPRHGIPAHGKADKRPDGGGEFFRSRGIGLESRLTCFCCGSEKRDVDSNSYLNNIAAFVECKEAGERVVEMFSNQKGGARLDYREYEPDRVQVKIGACDKHLENLRRLNSLVSEDIITETMIVTAMKS